MGSAGADPYWHLVAMFYHQMSGLGRGWLTYNREEVGAVPDDMDPEHGVWFVNFFPDVYDYIARSKKEYRVAPHEYTKEPSLKQTAKTKISCLHT